MNRPLEQNLHRLIDMNPKVGHSTSFNFQCTLCTQCDTDASKEDHSGTIQMNVPCKRYIVANSPLLKSTAYPEFNTLYTSYTVIGLSDPSLYRIYLHRLHIITAEEAIITFLLQTSKLAQKNATKIESVFLS